MWHPYAFLTHLYGDRYLKTFKPASGHMVDQPLQKHHLYSCARNLLVERFPDLIQHGKVTVLHPVSTTAFIVPHFSWHKLKYLQLMLLFKAVSYD